jgi:hypothetical protein
MFNIHPVLAQSSDKTIQVIEGGKLIVELVKAINARKDQAKTEDCKDRHADLCVINKSTSAIIVRLEQRATNENREIVIPVNGTECFLQVATGVWTYDLKVSGELNSLRKGDVRIVGCSNLDMTIK